MIVDEVARRFALGSWRNRDGAEQGLLRERNVLLAKPVTFMNNSGSPLRIIASWYKVPPEHLLAISDDLDLPFGKLRMRRSGSSGGHNGLRSIITYFGEDFPRLRVGIGRDHDGEAIGRVLGKFSEVERAGLPAIIEAGADTVERWLDAGLEPAMQFANSWTLPAPT
jgi:PTH1 family peptidyl-tRNA hydrolase